MDLPRQRRRRGRRAMMYGAAVVVAVLGVTVGLKRYAGRAPEVPRDNLWIGTVERGPLLLQVQGQGSLVPVEIRWISAPMAGRVEKILVQPGAVVSADTVLAALSNPDAELAALDAEREVAAAEAALVNLRATLDGQVLGQESTLATLESDEAMAGVRARADREMSRQGVVSQLDADESNGRTEQLTKRVEFERRRLGALRRGTAAQVAAQRAEIDRLRALAAFRQRQLEGLTLRAGVDGVLQELPLQAGQSVAAGALCAKVVNPAKLKAELRVAELQAKDLAIGLAATVDTRSGKVAGTVARIDPAAVNGTVKVDIAFSETGDALPKGARPDLTVDGVIELEKTGDILHVGRPAIGESHSNVTLFKLVGDDEAVRVPVTLGRAAVKDIEVVRGLAAGDRVILSDISRWDGIDRIRLR